MGIASVANEKLCRLTQERFLRNIFTVSVVFWASFSLKKSLFCFLSELHFLLCVFPLTFPHLCVVSQSKAVCGRFFTF